MPKTPEDALSDLQNWVIGGLVCILVLAISFVVFASWQAVALSKDTARRDALSARNCASIQKEAGTVESLLQFVVSSPRLRGISHDDPSVAPYYRAITSMDQIRLQACFPPS